ncbi:MAG: phenylalanine--tRNA ligase subunit beta, partial [Acetatifactor sp.]|nr:phenylalanine--tRNA ligase subunit beta [Acetatifactor sp.]
YTETEVKREGFSVTVDAPELCPRYIVHYVYDVKIGESPLWMKRRLALVGQEAVSNIVDITNYVSMEMGQPMHAFDCDYLEGNAIRVRRAEEGEPIITLDSKEYTLTPNNLVICDGVKPVAIAGVMGGLNSEIRDTTKEVMFESAKFARDNIRKTSRALGKRTDASAKYEKGVDEYATIHAMKRALHLIEELGCGKVSCTHVDVNTGNSVEPKELRVSIRRVNDVLGIEVPNEEILHIMKNLQFAPVINGDELTLQVPAYREDMETYQDVAEEVIRMYGYEHVVSTFMPDAKVTMGGLNQAQKKELRLKRILCSIGAYECIHYSFISPSDLNMLRLPEDAPERKAIRILNPINEELSLMRTTLAASMLNAVARNQKKGNLSGRLFEVGKIFIPEELPLKAYPDERDTLCIGIFGEQESFFTLKGMAEELAGALFGPFSYKPAERPYLHPYQTADILCAGEVVGCLGKVAYEVAEELDLRSSAYLLELDLKKLFAMCDKKEVFTPLSKFPEEKRDLALVMSKDVTCGQVEEVIRNACSHVGDIRLFDVYEGGQIPRDKKSMAFTVQFIPGEEAFEADSVDRFVKKILNNLKYHLDIELRS